MGGGPIGIQEQRKSGGCGIGLNQSGGAVLQQLGFDLGLQFIRKGAGGEVFGAEIEGLMHFLMGKYGHGLGLGFGSALDDLPARFPQMLDFTAGKKGLEFNHGKGLGVFGADRVEMLKGVAGGDIPVLIGLPSGLDGFGVVPHADNDNAFFFDQIHRELGHDDSFHNREDIQNENEQYNICGTLRAAKAKIGGFLIIHGLIIGNLDIAALILGALCGFG